MAQQLEDIRDFLKVELGEGDGDGYGDGYGYGYGDGYGDGVGYGYGDGDGDGSGDGIKQFNGRNVYMIDEVATLIDNMHVSYAKGSILNSDFTLTPCYVARYGNCFAHGKTLRQAFNEAREKDMEHRPLEERVNMFRKEFPDPDKKIPARTLYNWHHILTGSCTAGRDSFARDHSISIDSDEFTVREFIKITCQSYGGENIRRLALAYNITEIH